MKKTGGFLVISNTVECLGPTAYIIENSDSWIKKQYKKIRLQLWKLKMKIIEG